MHIFWIYITDSRLVFLSSTVYALSIETKIIFCEPEQREDNSYNLYNGQSKFSYKLTFWLISIEKLGK